jgi:hypothetical protein
MLSDRISIVIGLLVGACVAWLLRRAPPPMRTPTMLSYTQHPRAATPPDQHSRSVIAAAAAAGAPPPPLVEPLLPPAKVAICVGGFLELSIPRRGASLREHVLSVMPSDVFVAGTIRGNLTAERTARVLDGIRAVGPFASTSVIRMPRPADLRAALKSSGHWEDFKLQASKRGSGRFNWDDHYFDDPTTWVPIMMSPALGNPNGNTLQEFHYQSRCIDMINAYERSGGVSSFGAGGRSASPDATDGGAAHSSALAQAERRLRRARPAGMRYERVMFTRLEFEWLAPHPPLSLLDPKYLWVPTGEDNTGVNDRHWLANRHDAEGAFRRWDALLNGLFHQIFFATTKVRPAFMSSETFNKLHLQYRKVGVARFPNVAALQCCGTNYAAGSSAARRGMHCFAKNCHRTPCPRQASLPTPSCGARAVAHSLGHKYEAEGHSAVLHATALSLPGARLVPAPDATPARLHIELPPLPVSTRASLNLDSRAAAAADRVGYLYTCKVCEGGPTVPDPVSINVTSCLFHGHTYADPLLEAARKVHNCRYFSEPHLARVCAAIGDAEERNGRFGWFCRDVEHLQGSTATATH